MSVRQHLLVTLCACLAITLAATYALHLGQQREIAAFARAFSAERREQLDDAVAEESRQLALFVQDYSQWDEMARFVESGDREWARLNIDEVMARFDLDAVWVLSNSGAVIYQAFRSPQTALALPGGLDRLAALQAGAEEARGGFYSAGGRTVDFRALSIHPTADTLRATPAAGWLAAARVLDGRGIDTLARKLKAAVTLHPPGREEVEAGEGELAVSHPLQGFPSGETPAVVHATFKLKSLELGEHYNRRESLILAGSGVFLFALVAWSLNRNVLRPLKRIGESLELHSPRPLEEVPARLPEFLRIAALIRSAFRQQEALHNEILERARLGRDLHDGVIQNLYATGLGIAQGQRLIARDPAAAAKRLEETRRTLNETMEHLRRFIERVEPEESPDVAFADACVALFQTLRVHRDCTLDLQVDEGAEARLAPSSKAALLLIVREAVSNALRHGRAKRVGVSLLPEGQGVRLRVDDDGAGYDPSRVQAGGRGLGNMRARAADLGASLAVETAPGRGVALTVAWSGGTAGRPAAA